MTATTLLLLLLAPCCQAWISTPSLVNRSNHKTRLYVETQYTLDGETIRGPLTPMGNFCLVKTKDTLTATEGGILLPDQSKERPTEGVVIAAGPGRIHPLTGARMTNPISQGDSVLYGKFDGQPVVYNDNQCQMIRDDDVMLFYQGMSMTLDNITPCRDYILVEMAQEKLETNSGIAIAAQVTKEDLLCEGTVAKVGGGRMTSTGNVSKPSVNVGDLVKFKDYAGNSVMIAGKPYMLVRNIDILASMPKGDEKGEP